VKRSLTGRQQLWSALTARVDPDVGQNMIDSRLRAW